MYLYESETEHLEKIKKLIDASGTLDKYFQKATNEKEKWEHFNHFLSTVLDSSAKNIQSIGKKKEKNYFLPFDELKFLHNFYQNYEMNKQDLDRFLDDILYNMTVCIINQKESEVNSNHEENSSNVMINKMKSLLKNS